jgi:predicted lipid-binding transport protein (Tim44 family)
MTSLFSGRRHPDSPWIVLVEGMPAEEHRYRLAAEIARARLLVTRYLASRSKSSPAQAASAYPNATNDPAVVREPARQQQPSSTSHTSPVVGAACGGEERLRREP